MVSVLVMEAALCSGPQLIQRLVNVLKIRDTSTNSLHNLSWSHLEEGAEST